MESFDAIVIGAGQSGGPLSTALAKAGKKTAIVEGSHVGGTCINYGCTPTKTMVASAAAADLARRASVYGVHTGQVQVNMAEVRARKESVVERFRGSTRRAILSGGAELIEGWARFTGPKTLEIDLNGGGQRQMTAPLILINTGGRPRTPDLPGLGSVHFLDSTTIMDLDEIPEHLLVMGGGYVGLEFGQMFRRFGSQVTIVQRAGQLLPLEDGDIARAVQEILEQDGIQVLLDTEATRVEQSGQEICLSVDSPGGARTLVGSHLLVAVGRAPNTERLNLPAAGVTLDAHGNIPVDDRLETNIKGIYAMGDVNGGPAFTHISYDDFRILRANLLKGGNLSTRGRLVPYVVFIDPQLGRIGVTEAQARKAGRKVLVGTYPMEFVSRAIETDQRRGLMKAVVDAETKQILGAAVLGMDGGEIMSLIEVAMMGKLPYSALRDGIFAHPTLAEAVNSLFDSLK